MRDPAHCQLAKASYVHLFPPPVQWYHTGRLKSAMVEVHTLWVLANSKIKVLFLFWKPFLKHFTYQSTLHRSMEDNSRRSECSKRDTSSLVPSCFKGSIFKIISSVLLHSSIKQTHLIVSSHKWYDNIISSLTF